MTFPSSPTPTPLQDLEDVTSSRDNIMPVEWGMAYDRLRAFLESPAVVALSDPALRDVFWRLVCITCADTPRIAAWLKDESHEQAQQDESVGIHADYSLSEALFVLADFLTALHEAAQAMPAEQRSCEAAKVQADGEGL